MKRKFLSGLLALSMVLTLLPGTALAAETALTITPATDNASGIAQDSNDENKWKVEAIAEDATVSNGENIMTLSVKTADGVVLDTDAVPTVTVTAGTIAADKIDAGKFTPAEQANEAKVTIDIKGLAAGDYAVKADVEVPEVTADPENSIEAADAYTATGTFAFTITEAQPTTYTVSGKVTAGTTEVADLTQIAVQLYKYENDARGEAVGEVVKTGAEGAFSFTGVAAGTYVAVVAAVGGSYAESASAEFTVAGNVTTGADITLQKEAAEKKVLAAGDFTVAENVVYDGQDHKATAVTITDDANKTAQVAYTFKVNGVEVSDVKNAGTYAVTAKVTGDDNFAAVDEIALDDFVIAQKELSFAAKDQTIKVGGTVPVLTNPVLDTHYTIAGLIDADKTNAASIVTAVAMKYTDAQGADAANPDATAAGTYKIVITGATIATPSNYKAAASNPYTNGTLTISADGKVTATKIELNKTTLELAVDATEQLTAALTPANSTDTVEFTSSDETIATVSETGLVTAKAAGTATITASIKNATAEQADVKATCAVTVTAATVPVTGVTVDPTEARLEVGATKQLTATVTPAEATVKTVTYTSSNTDVATVNADGLVTAISAGTATITVRSTADAAKMDTCAVTVTAPAPVYTMPTPIAAKLHDTAGNITDADLVGTYTIGTVTTDAATGKITVPITATNLQKHTNAEGQEGYWVGFALAAPDQEATNARWKFAATEAELTVEEKALEANINDDGDKGIAFHANYNEEGTYKKFAKVQWLDKDGNVITIDGKDTFVYEMALTVTTVNPDVKVEAGAPNVPEPDKTDMTPAEGTIADAAYSAITTAVSGATKVVEDDVLKDTVTKMDNYAEVTQQEVTDAHVTALNETSVTGATAETAVVVIQPFMDIKITGVTANATNATKADELVVDITPMYRVVLTTEANVANIQVVGDAGITQADQANAVVISERPETIDVKPGETITVKIPVPTAFADHGETVFVTHRNVEHECTVDSGIVTVQNKSGFSEFKLSKASSAVAKIGSERYMTLADAVAAVPENGDVEITLLENVANEAITIDEVKTITITLNGHTLADTVTFTVADADTLKLVKENVLSDPNDQTSVTGVKVIVTERPAPPAAPVIDPGTQEFPRGTTTADVTITVVAGTTVYYTKNGDAPTQVESTTNIKLTATDTFTVDLPATVKAIAVKDGEVSTVATATYTVAKKNSSSNNSSGGGGGGATTSSTVAISGDGSSVKADVKISGGTATIGKVDDIKKIIGEDVVTIDASGLKKDIDTVKVDSSIVNAIANNEDSEGLEIKLSDGTVTFDADAVASLKGGDMTVKLDKTNANSLNSKQKDAVKDMDAQAYYELTINKALKDGQADVRIPFAVPDGKDASDMALVRVSESGEAEEVSARFSGGEVRFTATESGDYVIVAKAAQAAEPEQPTTPAQPTADFRDVDAGAWYGNAVNYVVANGLMSGVGNGQFAPNTNLSRAMLAQILYNQAGRPAAGDAAFNDVASGMWYTNAIAWAAAQGVVSGYGNGMFGPNDNITREQLAVMLYRYAGSPAADGSLDSFADAGKVSGYAQNALVWATTNGVMSGKGAGNLDPAGLATRAEVAQMLYNYLNK